MARRLSRTLPPLCRLGLTVVAIGLAVDIVHHTFTQDIAALRWLGLDVFGHAMTLAGMVLALLGVVRAAADERRRARQKGESNAARSGAAASR